MTPSLISVKKLRLTPNIVKTLQSIKIKKMSDLEVILGRLFHLNEDDLIKVRKEIERILNESLDR